MCAEGENPSVGIHVGDDAVDWPLYFRLLRGGDAEKTERDSIIEDAVSNFTDGIVDDPAYQADAMVEGVNTPIAVNRKSPIEADVTAVPGTDINTGDHVECLGEDWVVVEQYTDKIGIVHAVIWVCNYILKFQNHSSEVHERYCVVDDGSYSKRNNNQKAYMASNTYNVYVGIDAQTNLLYVDKRLHLGNAVNSSGEDTMEVYKIYGIDKLSKNFGSDSHLMVMEVQRDVYDPHKDSMELGVCDVFVPEDVDPGPAVTGSCKIGGRDQIRLGSSRRYTASFYDEWGRPADVPTESILWRVAPDPAPIECSVSEGVLVLSAPLKEDLIGDEVTLTLRDSGGLYGTYEMKVTVIAVG